MTDIGNQSEKKISRISSSSMDDLQGSQASSTNGTVADKEGKSSQKKDRKQTSFLTRISRSARDFFVYLRQSGPIDFLIRNRWYNLFAVGGLATAYLFRQQIYASLSSEGGLGSPLAGPSSSSGPGLEASTQTLVPQPTSPARTAPPAGAGTDSGAASSLLEDVQSALFSTFVACSAYLLWQLSIGQNTFNGKRNSDLEGSGQKAKTFADVGGCEKAKEAILEIIDFIKAPEAYQKMGLRMPKGVLLHGPPGTGKTLIAKAAAKEAGIPFIFTSGSEFVEIYVGNGAKKVRELFNQARSFKVPVMIFIDEIDAVGYKRNQYGQANREQEQTLNQLLNEMDGFVENDRIVVVAATNIADSLDPALLRPGRFDRKVEIPLPEASERLKIFEIHLKAKPHSLTEEDLKEAAKGMDGYAGADIEQIVNRVGLQAVRTSRLQKKTGLPRISKRDILIAIEDYKKERQKTAKNLVGPANFMRLV